MMPSCPCSKSNVVKLAIKGRVAVGLELEFVCQVRGARSSGGKVVNAEQHKLINRSSVPRTVRMMTLWWPMVLTEYAGNMTRQCRQSALTCLSS